MDKIKMPKYLNTPDEEFCRYLWLENPDPVTTRLLKMVDALVAWRSIAEDPDEVIQMIENKDYEIEALGEDITEYQERIEKLEARTVIDMLTQMEEQIQGLKRKNRQLHDSVEEATRNEKIAQDQLGMWTILNR